MARKIDLARVQKPVRDFIRALGKIREPVDLLLDGKVVARIVSATDLLDDKKEHILNEGWAVVEKARTRTKGMSAAMIQDAVDDAIREVRARRR
jgi:hypothetical protein